MEPSCNQTMASTSKPKVMSFFPLWKLKGSQLTATPSAWVSHLEEVSANKVECIDSENPDGIEGITEEFIVCLASAVKDSQQEERCCYHCSSLGHFIHSWPLVVATRTDLHLKKRGDSTKEGSPSPSKR